MGSSLINLVSRRRVNPELFGEKDDKNSKDFHANAAHGKESCKRADSSPVFFIEHTTQHKRKSVKESMVYPSHLVRPPCSVLHAL